MLRLDESLFQLMRLNAAFANALGRATAEFLQDVATTLNQPRPFGPGEPRRAGASRAARHGDPPPYAEGAPPPPAPPAERVVPQPSVMLLEAEAGNAGFGLFLVENTLAHDVQVRVEASPFLDPPTAGAQPRLTFYPEAVNLAPREQITMRVMAAIDDTLEPDVRYRCELTVPALPGTRIPVVVRRRPSPVTPPRPVATSSRHVNPSTRKPSSAVPSSEVVALKPVPSIHAATKARRKRRRSA